MVAVACVAASALLAGRADAAIYWTAGTGVSRANLDGSAFQEEFIPPSPSGGGTSADCQGIAVSGSHIYWAEPATNSIAEANLDGTEPNFQFITGLANPCGMAIESPYLYWAEFKGGSIGRANLGGGEVNRAFVPGLKEPCGVAVAAGEVYWTAASTSEHPPGSYLARRPLAGGIDADLFEGWGLCGLATDSQHIYWGGFEKSIGRAGLDGSDPEPSFITGLDRPCGIAVEGSSIYWATNDSLTAAIQATELEGAHAVRTVVGVPRGDPCGVAVDSVVAQLPPPPVKPQPTIPLSHQVVFGPSRHSKNAAVTFVELKFPQAGTFTVSGGKALRLRVVPKHGASLTLAGAEGRLLKVWPRSGTAAKALRNRLQRKGKAQVTVRVHFAAADGTTSTERGSLTLVLPRRARTKTAPR
jgi:hypothetical protein